LIRLAAPLSVFIFGISAIPLLVVVSRSAPEESRSLLVPAVLMLTLAQPLPVFAWLVWL
jgi:hypothetical protein